MDKKQFNIIVILLLLGIVVGAVFLGFIYIKPSKVAYVRSQELVLGYLGTKEAQAKYDQKKLQWQANVDTLKVDFETSRLAYENEKNALSVSEKKAREEELYNQELQLKQYMQAINEKARQEDEEMMQAVLNQINSYTKKYAEEKGYDMIFGTTLSGSMLYGKEELDITKELLQSLNQHYNGEK